MDGRRIVITGRDTDIGRAVAQACTNAGATVAERPACLAGQVWEDTSAEEFRRNLPIHGLVHTGQREVSPEPATAAESLRRQFDDLCVAPILMTRHLASKGELEDGGAIIFLTSILAHVGIDGSSLNAGIEGAVLGSARSLSLELAPRRIRVNCVSAACLKLNASSSLVGARDNPGTQAAPLGIGDLDDVALATVFLLSDASRWITGTSLRMTGASAWISP